MSAEKEKFWLGAIVDTHNVVGHMVIEYHPNVYVNGVANGQIDTEKMAFSTGGNSFDSLAKAVVFVGLLKGGVNENTASTLTYVIMDGAAS